MTDVRTAMIPMRAHFLFLFAAIFLVSCGRDPQGEIQGPIMPPVAIASEPAPVVENLPLPQAAVRELMAVPEPPKVKYYPRRKKKNQSVPKLPLPEVETGIESLAVNAVAPNQSTLPPPTETTEPVEADNETVEPMQPGLLFGKLELDSEVSDWLESRRGHIELYLHAIGSRDPQDTIFLDYQYPNNEFAIDLKELKGNYRLYAGFFQPRNQSAVAQVAHPIKINSSSHRTLQFSLRASELYQALSKAGALSSARRNLNAVVFAAPSVEYRNPEPVAGATVRILGMGPSAERKTDSQGNMKIPFLPSHSEFMVEVSAPGFLPTVQIVPSFASSVYAPIYLLSSTIVDTITRYFQNKPQVPEAGVLMGRIFDTENRTPKDSARVSLVSRVARPPLYFGTLPDPLLKETSSNGLFGFFNLAPSFRLLKRENGEAPLVVGIKRGFGQFVELGRGGAHTLLGRVVAPLEGAPVPFQVRLVGSPESETITDEHGNFEFPGIDLGPGLISVEIEGPGYPKSWHSLAWHPREPEKRRDLYMLQEGLIDENANRFARLKRDPKLGSLVGALDNSFFKTDRTCLRVSLQKPDGTPIDPQHGPFGFSTQPGMTENRPPGSCLTRAYPAYAYYNLPDGEYILQLTLGGKIARAHVSRVGLGRVTILVN